jgi:FAD:protein FMN transferase
MAAMDSGAATWSALGTTTFLRVTDPDLFPAARAILNDELDAIARAASRFSADSELSMANGACGTRVPISPLLHEAIAVALRAAALTDGAVDPTLGFALRRAGYARDYAELRHVSADEPVTLDASGGRSVIRAGSAWRQVRLFDRPAGLIVPAGISLDLGATAKALCADRAATRIAAETGAGALVSLGGDIATAGPAPEGGWLIHVTDDHRDGPDAPGQTVSIHTGALATSSTTTRRWRHHGLVAHHILDPQTGMPASGPWRTVSVVAATCVDANIASTAAIVLGDHAEEWLTRHGLAARLVTDGRIATRLGGWPQADRDGSSA